MTPALSNLPDLPLIRLAGLYPLEKYTGNHKEYRTNHPTLHLYDYAVTLRNNGAEYHLQPGDVAVASTDDGVYYEAPVPGTHFCFHLVFPSSRSEQLVIPHFETFTPGVAFDTNVRLLRSIAEQHYSTSPWQQWNASASLLQFILNLQARKNETPKTTSKIDAAIHQVKGIVDTYLSSSLRVADLAKQTDIDANYLARQFKAKEGVTIQQYIMQRRLQRARHWIINSDSPIKSIAVDCGFYDVQHFYRNFKQHYNALPNDLRS